MSCRLAAEWKREARSQTIRPSNNERFVWLLASLFRMCQNSRLGETLKFGEVRTLVEGNDSMMNGAS